MEQKGRDVPDVRTPACMKAPEVPPLLVRASDQSPEKIAGRLSKFSGAWSEIGADPWVMRIVQWGYKIPFVTLPPLRFQGQETTYPKGSLKWSSLNQSVQELRNKGAIEPAPLSPGFYSRLFLVRKATGEWRPIIDLSSLNVFVHCPSFTMETPRSILRALQQGQWLTSLDLKDAYFHIGIHPADRRYLRFCHNGTSWQFTVLPFGLSTSPRVFTKILKPVLAYAHLHRVKLHMYLDDWLLNPGTRQEAHEQTSWLRSLCQKLGLVINLEKSDLIPSQVSTYLGIELDTSVGLARPSLKRLTNWLSVAEGFTAQQSPPAVQWLQVLGHLVSLEKLVPYGRTRIRPIQWQLRLQWNQSKEKSSKLIPLDLQSRLAILWWTNRENLRRGVPVGTIDVECYLYSDSSTQGWGAHLQDLTASGIWSQDQAQLHINVLELQAIWLGLRAFSQRVENTRVALMSDNTSAVAYLRNQGGTKSLAMNDLATDICLWAEKRGMTLVPRYLPGHLNVLADHLSRRGQILKTEWSLNQTVADRIFRAWGRPFVDLFALGKNTKLAIYVSPIREETSWESGQSCPELGRPVRVCVPSDKPDKGLSKQGQNRKRRDCPNSASLAQLGMVSGPPRSLNRLSNISPTSAETAQANLLTPLSSASVASQPSRLEVIKGFHKERGFSEAVAQRLAISQRQSSAVVYESKWKVFGEWCHVKQIDPVKATVQQLADFLIFLFEEKKLAISSIQGYRSCISKVFLARGIDISHDRDLNMLVRNFAIERPVQHREAPRWDLMVVLRLLMKPPFEPMNMASVADMTRKLAFLLTLATAKRNSEVWAFSADVRFGQDYNAATLSFLPNFLAKTMDPSRPETAYAPVTIPALGPSMGEDLPDRFLYPVRALRYYLKLKHKGLDPNNRFRRLLCAFKLGHIGDISKQTVSGWIRQLIKQAYSAVQDEDIPHLTHTNFQARELRAFASSLAFHQNYSLKQVMEAASWRNNNTFVSFYLRDLSQMGDVTTAGPFVAGQKVISC